MVPSADYQSYINPHPKRWTDDWKTYETPHSTHYTIEVFYIYRVFGRIFSADLTFFIIIAKLVYLWTLFGLAWSGGILSLLINSEKLKFIDGELKNRWTLILLTFVNEIIRSNESGTDESPFKLIRNRQISSTPDVAKRVHDSATWCFTTQRPDGFRIFTRFLSRLLWSFSSTSIRCFLLRYWN